MKTPSETTNLTKRRGIYLLPNILTLIALFSGFYAIIAAMKDDFQASAIAIFFAMIFDGLDGRIARMTNTSSAFGTELDSLSDMVCFGVAPALIAYNWALGDLGKIGWLSAFIFTAGTALRLARFNTQVSKVSQNYFQGLPSPVAAANIASLVWASDKLGVGGENISWLVAVFSLLVGVSMVSNFRYYSFKKFDLKDKVPFVTILAAVTILVFIAVSPAFILLGSSLIYLLSGPFLTLWMLIKHKKHR